ncbi:MAG: ATP-binding protein [Polyangiaceae bacterium]|nr:ATP-binding protein [Polyangiaceae bacterium]
MTFLPRALDLRTLVAKRSCFLFGPRQTGKTSWLAAQFPDALRIDLLDEEQYLALTVRPGRLAERLPARGVVVIDEIQRVPALLNEVHRAIEARRDLRFVLTGSSARKLRRGGTNLLGGRARSRRLHPFVRAELGVRFELARALTVGSLPSIYLSDEPREDLKAYVGDYLREEIAAEAVTRSIPSFGRFLETAAASNGRVLNYQNIANDAEVKRSTVQNYYQILRDTLLGSDLEPFRRTRSRKAVASAKFFFFDLGVVNLLRGVREIPERTPLFGEAFEAYIHHELATFLDYRGDGELRYWRSTSGFEVDFVVDGEVGIECKTTRSVAPADLKGLRALDEEVRLAKKIVVCFEPAARTVDGIDILPWRDMLDRLWRGEIVGAAR